MEALALTGYQMYLHNWVSWGQSWDVEILTHAILTYGSVWRETPSHGPVVPLPSGGINWWLAKSGSLGGEGQVLVIPCCSSSTSTFSLFSKKTKEMHCWVRRWIQQLALTQPCRMTAFGQKETFAGLIHLPKVHSSGVTSYNHQVTRQEVHIAVQHFKATLSVYFVLKVF